VRVCKRRKQERNVVKYHKIWLQFFKDSRRWTIKAQHASRQLTLNKTTVVDKGFDRKKRKESKNFVSGSKRIQFRGRNMLTSSVNPELSRLPLRFRETGDKFSLDNIDKGVSNSNVVVFERVLFVSGTWFIRGDLGIF